MENQINILVKSRKLILKLIDGCSLTQLNTIPDGFNNNIVWNIGHLVATQQVLCYKLSGEKMYLSDEFIEMYKKGSSPKRDITAQEFDEIKYNLLKLPELFLKDYNNNLFKNYTEYTTSVGVTLTSVASAFEFNTFHEGIHLGVVLAMRKLV